MKTPYASISLLTALALAGCAATPAAAPVATRINGEPAAAPAYTVLQAAPVGTTYTASSEANTTFYASANATDGVETSSWRPAGGDTMPWLRFDLPSPVLLSGLGIKLSLGRNATATSGRVYVAVETSDDGLSWSTLAMGLQPTETVLQTLDLPDRSARHVRVSFVASGTNDLAELRVCEVQLVEGVLPVQDPAVPGDGGDGNDGGDSNTGGGNGDGGTGGDGNTNTGNRGVGQGNGGGNGTPNEGSGGNGRNGGGA